jgi:hypothetical protein
MPVTAMQPRTKNRTRDIVRITIRPSGIQEFFDNMGAETALGTRSPATPFRAQLDHVKGKSPDKKISEKT